MSDLLVQIKADMKEAIESYSPKTTRSQIIETKTNKIIFKHY